MHVLILGAAGMIGRKLAFHLPKRGILAGRDITALSLADVTLPGQPAGFAGTSSVASVDIADPGAVAKCIADRPHVIFHLAAIVWGEAEADFDKGYRVNLDGTRHLLEGIRHEGRQAPYRPRLVFASSIAVFGAPFPDRIEDEFHTTPLTSCGTQKAISELLLADYSRRGIVDGIAIRLPTICIRPGTPDKAASGFFSNILREPLAGQEAVLPVRTDIRHWHASPRTAIGFLAHAAAIDLGRPWARRARSPCRASARPWPSRSRRCAGSPARRRCDSYAESPIPSSPGSSQAGRAPSIRAARSPWASRRMCRSTTSFASISRRNSAVVFRSRNERCAAPTRGSDVRDR